MSLPKTFKACVIDEPNQPFTIREIELRHPGEGQILIKVKTCGVCFSDVATQTGNMGGLAKWPVIPGHEVVGDIVEVGPGVKKWKIGDRVGGAWHGGQCQVCRPCKQGFVQGCVEQQVNGVTKEGGYAEYCNLQAEAAVSVSKELDPVQVAPLLCAGVTVYNSMRNMSVMPGEVVAIQGLGGLGHLALQYARKMGFHVVAISSSDSKKDFATQLGAHDYIDASKQDVVEALNKLGGAKMTVTTAPNPKILTQLTGGLAVKGKLLNLAPVGEVPINTIDLVMKGASVHGWPAGSSQDCEDAIDFAQHLDVKCMSEPFPFEKVQEAVDHLISGKARFRCVLTMD